MSHPDLDTPLGRAWLRAASIEHSVKSLGMEGDPALLQQVSDLAHCIKVLAEYIELIINNRSIP